MENIKILKSKNTKQTLHQFRQCNLEIKVIIMYWIINKETYPPYNLHLYIFQLDIQVVYCLYSSFERVPLAYHLEALGLCQSVESKYIAL